MREEMTLKELLGIVCARWRVLLALAIVFALLLGGYRTYSGIQVLSDTAAVKKAQELNRLELEQYESKKEMLQQEIEQLQRKEQQAGRYNENSLLLRIDPYSKEVATLTFSVNADADTFVQGMPESWQIPAYIETKAEREDRIANQYLLLANAASFSKLMTGTQYAQIKDQYLREIVCVSKYAPGTLTIEACTTEYMAGMELAQRIYEYCLGKQETIAAIVGAHTLTPMDAGNVAQVDALLADTQLLAQSQPANIASQLSAKLKEFQELTRPAASALMTPDAAVKSGVKYAVLGAAVGVCIGAMIAFLMETMGANFTSGAALAQALCARYLGNLHVNKQKKGLDAWAEKLGREDVYSTVAAQDRLPLLAANIKAAAEEKRALLITGLRPQSELEAFIEDLRPHIGSEYRLVAAANLLVNAQAIQELKNVEGVLIVEGEKTARMERLIQLKQYLDEAKCTLMGIVWA